MTLAAIDARESKTYLTQMSAHTKLSAKGQVVIPKDVRDRLGLTQGMVLDVIERGSELVLRPRDGGRTGKTAREALREIQSFYRYEGAKVSLEDMDRAVREAVQKKFGRSTTSRPTKQ